MLLRIARAVVLCALAGPAFAQQASPQAEPPRHETLAPAPTRENPDLAITEPAVTHHSLNLAGRTLRYTATAGRIALKAETGDVEAALFFTAYTLDGENAHSRPLTFAFNGGPGTGTVWLHLGALGPKKIRLEREGFVPAPPYAVADNPETILDKTDLVFIDAPGTGFSRVKPDAARKFYSINGDAEAFGRFIRLYLTRYNRWGSPLFLFGESYGTTRAAALANHLVDDAIPVSGIILLSVGLDFQTLNPGNLNDLPYQLVVPSYTMIAAYHHKLAPELAGDLPATLTKVENWCSGEYAQVLAEGSAVSPERREKAVAQLSAFTGLSPEVIAENDLRVDVNTFMRSLLKDQKLNVGRIDGRFTGPLPQSAGNVPFFDPSMAQMFPAFSAAMNDYSENELNYRQDPAYKIYNREEVPAKWEWGPAMQGYPQTASLLQSAMAKSKYLKVLVMEGMYDLATPYFASRYTFRHMHLSPDRLKDIRFAEFKAGHMVYNDAAALSEMKRTVDEYYRDVLRASAAGGR